MPGVEQSRGWVRALLGTVLAFSSVTVLTTVSLHLIDAPEDSAQASAPDPTSSPSDARSVASTDANPATPPATPSPSDDSLTCWDGTATRALASCPILTGEAGLRWVFPDFAVAAARCLPATLYDDKLTARNCRIVVSTGIEVGATFSEYAGPDDVTRHYGAKFGAPADRGDRLVYGPSVINDRAWEASAVLPDGRRWAVTLASQDEAKVAAAIGLVRIRTIQEFNDHVGPPPTPID